MVRKYFLLKKLNSPDKVIIDNINKGRVQAGFQSSVLPPDLLLNENPVQKFILHRLRIEEPELWTDENISDEIILKNIKKAINMYVNSDF